jgi:hypothetical protein
MSIQGNNLTGRSITASTVALSPSNILQPPSHCCTFFPERKKFQKTLLFHFLSFLKLSNHEIQLRETA